MNALEPQKRIWTFDESLRLIEAVRKRLMIWCAEKKVDRSSCWSEVAEEINVKDVDESAAKAKFANLRNTFRVCLHKSRKTNPGVPPKLLKNRWIFFDHMKFLIDPSKPVYKTNKDEIPRLDAPPTTSRNITRSTRSTTSLKHTYSGAAKKIKKQTVDASNGLGDQNCETPKQEQIKISKCPQLIHKRNSKLSISSAANKWTKTSVNSSIVQKVNNGRSNEKDITNESVNSAISNSFITSTLRNSTPASNLGNIQGYPEISVRIAENKNNKTYCPTFSDRLNRTVEMPQLNNVNLTCNTLKQPYNNIQTNNSLDANATFCNHLLTELQMLPSSNACKLRRILSRAMCDFMDSCDDTQSESLLNNLNQGPNLSIPFEKDEPNVVNLIDDA